MKIAVSIENREGLRTGAKYVNRCCPDVNRRRAETRATGSIVWLTLTPLNAYMALVKSFIDAMGGLPEPIAAGAHVIKYYQI